MRTIDRAHASASASVPKAFIGKGGGTTHARAVRTLRTIADRVYIETHVTEQFGAAFRRSKQSVNMRRCLALGGFVLLLSTRVANGTWTALAASTREMTCLTSSSVMTPLYVIMRIRL